MSDTVRSELEALKVAQEANAAMVEFLRRAVRVYADMQKHVAVMKACVEKVPEDQWPAGLLQEAGGGVSILDEALARLEQENAAVVNWEAPEGE